MSVRTTENPSNCWTALPSPQMLMSTESRSARCSSTTWAAYTTRWTSSTWQHSTLGELWKKMTKLWQLCHKLTRVCTICFMLLLKCILYLFTLLLWLINTASNNDKNSNEGKSECRMNQKTMEACRQEYVHCVFYGSVEMHTVPLHFTFVTHQHWK